MWCFAFYLVGLTSLLTCLHVALLRACSVFLHYIVHSFLSYFSSTVMPDYAAALSTLRLDPCLCFIRFSAFGTVGGVPTCFFSPAEQTLCMIFRYGTINLLLRFLILICQFCDTIEWSGSGECLLLTLSDVITRASDLVCLVELNWIIPRLI